MQNPYVIILALFALLGPLVMFWGWRILRKAMQTRAWPCVEGVIHVSEPSSRHDDLLPHIEYSYEVAGKSFRSILAFDADISPTPEFSASYVKKYPVGRVVEVHYDPARPEHSTLEPGLGAGDWMVFALGLVMTVSGVLFLLAEV